MIWTLVDQKSPTYEFHFSQASSFPVSRDFFVTASAAGTLSRGTEQVVG